MVISNLDVDGDVEAIHLIQQFKQDTLDLAIRYHHNSYHGKYHEGYSISLVNNSECLLYQNMANDDTIKLSHKIPPVCASKRLVAMASISSIKMMHGAFSRAYINTSTLTSQHVYTTTNMRQKYHIILASTTIAINIQSIAVDITIIIKHHQ
jgi:hypothetical protein